VNISSLGGLAAFGTTGYYHATKLAVEGLSESLAAEVAPLGIKVTIVEPAAFRTNWSGPSMRHSPVHIEDYSETAVGAQQPPLRLLLGKFAYEIASARLDSLRDNFDTWRDLTRSVDYPEDATAGLPGKRSSASLCRPASPVAPKDLCARGVGSVPPPCAHRLNHAFRGTHGVVANLAPRSAERSPVSARIVGP
jgi:hypothetical protein